MAYALNHGTQPPLYRQVRNAIEEQITRGAFDFSRPLPSTRGLAVELGVSRNTVNLAYQELMAEGFIVSEPRRGLFVNEELHPDKVKPPRRTARSGSARWKGRLKAPGDALLPKVQKVPDWHRYPYVFIAGQVDARSFPTGAWTRVLREALYDPHLHFSLRDALEDDDPMLVQVLCREILPARGIDASPDEVLITMGSQEGLALLSGALLQPGSVVAVEDPGYLDARHIFSRRGASLLPLQVDGSGVIPPAELRGSDLLYLTPSHHHPTNVTLSIGRRQQLLSQAARADAIVVEDDYDSELRYHGTPSPALKGLDDQGRVVYLGTFSKFLAPGIRLGYLVAEAALIQYLREERRYDIRHPPGHVQRAMALFLASGRYHRAVRQHRTRLRHKWEAMCEAIEREFDWDVALPPGGVSIWVEGPAGLDATALAQTLLRQGVIIERGDIYYLEAKRHRNSFRLGFAATRPEAIAPGISIVARAAHQQLERNGAGQASVSSPGGLRRLR